MRIIALTAVLVLCAVPVTADEVILKDGGMVSGIIRSQTDDAVVVEVSAGTVTLKKADVKKISKGTSKLHEYYKLAKGASSAPGFVKVAQWAKENGLGRFFEPNMKKALDLDPNNETARRALGFTLHEGKWLTPDELRLARGYIRFEGKWMTPEERLTNIEHRLEMERMHFEAEVEREEAEWEARQERLEQARKMSTLPFGYLHRPGAFWPVYYRPYPYLNYRYKLPPNAWYWQGMTGAQVETPSARPPERPPHSEAGFEAAVNAEVERRLREILEELEREAEEEKPEASGKK
ncbi:MAG: hypothetical protein ACYTAF_04325 [Planctomycetota bacterium]|jgi:hypothetical protein